MPERAGEDLRVELHAEAHEPRGGLEDARLQLPVGHVDRPVHTALTVIGADEDRPATSMRVAALLRGFHALHLDPCPLLDSLADLRCEDHGVFCSCHTASGPPCW